MLYIRGGERAGIVAAPLGVHITGNRVAMIIHIIIVTLAIIAFGTRSTALAWGETGHRVVALIAANHCGPAARAAIGDLLGAEGLPDIASWADSIRPFRPCTGPWHYIDIPLGGVIIDTSRDCLPCEGAQRPTDSIGCLVFAIRHFRAVLADTSADRVLRVEALRFLVHFVGDLHQPLHTADNHDRGGNDVIVTLFGERLNPYGRGDRPWNLHAVWDAGLIEHTGRSAEEYAALLERSIVRGDQRALAGGGLLDWTAETHALAASVVYDLPAGSAPVDIAGEYYQRSIPVIDMQLARAGLRLARLLDEIFPSP